MSHHGEENLKEQQRKSRQSARQGQTVLELQQELAEELNKRKRLAAPSPCFD